MDTIYGLWILGILICLYWTPTFLAFHRKVASPWSITMINLFLGWTLIGWVVALALAVRDVPSVRTTPQNGQPT